MVHWGWLVVTAIVSGCVTMLMLSVLAINKDDPFEDDAEYIVEKF